MLVQRDLVAARKALKHSLKELDGAEGDRARLQKQVNKLSRTLQVSPHLPPPPGPLLPRAWSFSCAAAGNANAVMVVVAVVAGIHLPSCWYTSIGDVCRLP